MLFTITVEAFPFFTSFPCFITDTPDTELLGTTSLQINNLTGRIEFSNLRFSKEYNKDLQLLFAVTVSPHESRYDGLNATSAKFNISRQLYCLEEVLPNISPEEKRNFTQSAKLHILDCATGQVAVPKISINVSMITANVSDMEYFETLPMAKNNGSVVEFGTIKFNTWKINFTVIYTSLDIHNNVSVTT